MKNWVKKLFIGLILTILAGYLIGCSEKNVEKGSTDQNNEGQGKVNDNHDTNHEDPEEIHEPVTLLVQVHWDDEMFKERFKDPIEEAFSWITLEQVQSWRDRGNLEELFADGISPDIFFEVSHQDLEYFEIDYDLTELIEKHQYDLSHIHPVYLDSIRSKDKENRLLALPYEVINYVLFYNKNVFDLFGQPYPSDLMTWDEVLDLAVKLTGERNGTYYRGLDLGNIEAPLLQTPINLTDPDTGEVHLFQDEVIQYFDLIDKLVAIQSNDQGPYFDSSRFTEEQTTAMLVNFVQGLNWWQDTEGLNDAVAPLPVWDADNPLSHRPDGGLIHLSINPHSEHKDDAFRVISYFTESTYQTWASRNGIGPTTVDRAVLDQFFQDYESTHEKNVSSIFSHPPATPPDRISPWDRYVDLKVREYVDQGIDRNEHLRIVTEESEMKIEEAMERE